MDNVGLTNESIYVNDIKGHDFVGGIAGINFGTISNSYSSGTVTNTDNDGPIGQDAVGGLVGANWNDGTVSNISYSSVSVTNTDNSSYGFDVVGGLAGVNWGGTISDSYSSGDVTNTDNSSMGRYGYGSDLVGGFVGDNDNGGTVSTSFSSGSVSNTSDSGGDAVGGFVGGNYQSTVSNSYSLDFITNTDNSSIGYDFDDVGGFVGDNDGTVSETYSAGGVYNTDNALRPDYVGGFVGSEDRAVPEFNDPGGSCTNDYWDTLYNQSLPSAGYAWYTSSTGGPGPVAGVTPRSYSQMYYSSNFAGFDFSKVWGQVDGYTYPFLQAFETKINFPIFKNSYTLPLAAMPNFMPYSQFSGLQLTGFGIRDPLHDRIIIINLNKAGQKIAKKISKKGLNWLFKKAGANGEEASFLTDIVDALEGLLEFLGSL